ncbi:MAG: chemotaxis protein CheW [Candidatus Methylomirabilales bacterium]
MDMSKYVKMYVSESSERLQRMDQLLLVLEHNGADRSAIDTIFREAHSIKGMSASMGYEELAKVAHRMEDYLDQFRGGKGGLERQGIDLLFEGVDLLRRSVEEVAQGRPPSLAADEYQSKMASLLVAAGPPPPPPPASPEIAPSAAPAPAPGDTPALARYALEVTIAPDAPLPAARAYITLRRMRDLGELIRSAPSVEDVQAGRFSGTLSLLIATTRSAEEVKAFLAALPDVVGVLVRPAAEAPTASRPPEGRPPLEPPAAGAEPAPPAPATPGGDAASLPSIRRPANMMRVDARLLDDLMDQVGELVTANSQLEELSRALDSAFLHESAGRVGLLVKSLQQQALKLRMMPLELIADRFPRAVRDLARRRGKEVSFEVVGKDIELDRSVLEELPDPILHILRNCVDHGIEPAEERVRAGKPPAGLVRLEASKERESIVIRISDDGRGMDPARLRRLALERGLITREQHDRMPDADALALVTLPGFSTASSVSDVSGRGVGMDIVRSTVESLHGTLLVESVLGQGSTITLRLPLTLAVVAVLLIEVAGERYALPIASVEQTVEVEAGQLQRSQGQEMLPLEDGLIPLLPLAELLGCPAQGGNGRRLVVMCEMRRRLTGLVVDRLIGYREVVVKGLDKALRGVRGLAGVTILGDGHPVLILDVNTL